MEPFLCEIEDREVSPIRIKSGGKWYLTLHYYTKHSDSVLHGAGKRLFSFPSAEEMEAFCRRRDLKLDHEVYEYDFDVSMENPVPYSRILDNWNLLNTVAGTFGMYFEGDSPKYNGLYNLLFRLSTPAEPIPPVYSLCDRDLKLLWKVFRKKDRFLSLFEPYRD